LQSAVTPAVIFPQRKLYKNEEGKKGSIKNPKESLKGCNEYSKKEEEILEKSCRISIS